MRRAHLEITNKQIIEDILSSSGICRIAFNDNPVPYLLPFNYGYRDNCIYIHSAPEGKKIDLIKKDPRVCFEIEYASGIIKHEFPCRWSNRYRSVVGKGRIEIINDSREKQRGLEIIMAHNGHRDPFEFNKGEVDTIVLLKLAITEIRGKQSRNWENLKEQGSVRLESQRLLFEEVTREDLADIHELHSFPQVDEFNTLGIPAAIEETWQFLEPCLREQQNYPRNFFTWKLTQKEEERFAGIGGLKVSSDKFKIGEIYYKLRPDCWGKGYGTEAAKRMIQAGFDLFHLHKIEAGVATGNIRSIRVLEKAGMTREGMRRKILPIRGEWKDNYHYAIVEDDYVSYKE
jgi:[ribosomal protein S5]-alanine N-acetyltransferase